MKKKLVSILLCTVMAASLFAGCGNGSSDETSEPASGEESVQESEPADEEKSSMWLLGDEESAELSLGIKVNASDKDPDDMWFFQYYEEMTGVHMDVTTTLTEDWSDKKQLMMASGEYPGIIWAGGWTAEEVTEYSEDGTFLDLTDYMEYMPNYTKLMDQVDGWQSVTSPDGGMYTLATMDPAIYFSHNLLVIQQEWLENVGMEMPETLDDFYNVLKAFKEQDADGDGDANNEIPCSYYYAEDNNYLRNTVLNGFGFDVSGSSSSNIAIQSWNDEVVYMPLTERYKEYLSYMNKLMEEGLLDQDYYSQDQNQYLSKVTEDICGVVHDPFSVVQEKFEDYSTFTLKYDENSEQIVTGSSPVAFGAVVITDNCEDPVLAAKWIDLFYAPENAYNLQAGPIILEYPDGTLEYVSEGITEDTGVACHVMVDENGSYTGVSFPGATETLGAWDWLSLDHPANGMFNTTIGEYYYYGQLYEGFPGNKEEEIAYERSRYENTEGDVTDRSIGYYRAMQVESTYDYLTNGLPQVYFSAEQQEWLDEHKTILEDYVTQMEAKFITGAADLDTEYDAFIEELKNKGAEEYQAIYVELYNATAK